MRLMNHEPLTVPGANLQGQHRKERHQGNVGEPGSTVAHHSFLLGIQGLWGEQHSPSGQPPLSTAARPRLAAHPPNLGPQGCGATLVLRLWLSPQDGQAEKDGHSAVHAQGQQLLPLSPLHLSQPWGASSPLHHPHSHSMLSYHTLFSWPQAQPQASPV